MVAYFTKVKGHLDCINNFFTVGMAGHALSKLGRVVICLAKVRCNHLAFSGAGSKGHVNIWPCFCCVFHQAVLCYGLMLQLIWFLTASLPKWSGCHSSRLKHWPYLQHPGQCICRLHPETRATILVIAFSGVSGVAHWRCNCTHWLACATICQR